MDRADVGLPGGVFVVVGRDALRDVAEAFHLVSDAEATGEDPLVALEGQPALGPQALARIEAAVFALFGVRLPALIALDDPRDGRLVDVKSLCHPVLRFAFESDPVVNEMVVVVGSPRAAGTGLFGGGGGGGDHVGAPGVGNSEGRIQNTEIRPGV